MSSLPRNRWPVPVKRKTDVLIPESLLGEGQRRFPDLHERNGVLALFALRAVAQQVTDSANEHLLSVGLNAAQYNYLVVLYLSPNRRLTLKELSRHIHTSTASVTSMMKGLEADGLVERLANPADGRSFIARLTANGKKVLDRAVPLHLAFIKRGLAELSVRDRAELVRLLHSVSRSFENAGRSSPRSKSKKPPPSVLAVAKAISGASKRRKATP